LALDNKTESIFRKLGLCATSALLALNMACFKYEQINSKSNPALLLSSNSGTSLKAEYKSGKKLYLESNQKIKDVLSQFDINNYDVKKIENPDGETYNINTPFGYSICEQAFEDLKQDMKDQGIGDDIQATIRNKAKVK